MVGCVVRLGAKPKGKYSCLEKLKIEILPGKLAIFGCGSDLSTNIEKLKREFEIVRCDNNSALHGKKSMVSKSLNHKNHTFDFEILKMCSLANTTKIRTQVIDLGVPEEKIMPLPFGVIKILPSGPNLEMKGIERVFIIKSD